MFKKRRMVSVVLAVCLMCTCTLPVLATDREELISDEVLLEQLDHDSAYIDEANDTVPDEEKKQADQEKPDDENTNPMKEEEETETTALPERLHDVSAQEDLQAAIDGAADGDVIMLTGDIALSETVIANTDASYTIDGAGYTLTCADSRHLIINAGTVILADVTVDGQGGTGGVEAYNGSTLVMESGSAIKNCVTPYYGGGVFIQSGSLVINGGEISDNEATYTYPTQYDGGGGVYIERGDFTMHGGRITGNRAQNGGGLYLFEGNFEMHGGEISGNQVKNYGGGVCLDKCDVNLTAGEIAYNVTTEGYGGGVYYETYKLPDPSSPPTVNAIRVGAASISGSGVPDASVYVVFPNGDIRVDRVNSRGAWSVSVPNGVYLDEGVEIKAYQQEIGKGPSPTVTAIVLNTANSAVSKAAAPMASNVYANSFTMAGGSIHHNRGYLCAGVYLNGGEFTLSGGEISANEASYFIGGLGGGFNGIMTGGKINDNTNQHYDVAGLYTTETFVMYDGEISGNVCYQQGAGGASIGGSFIMYGGRISSNVSMHDQPDSWLTPGGVAVSGSMYVYGGEISDNRTLSQGGGVYIDGGYLELHGGEISRNTSSYNGGGVYESNGYLMLFDGAISENTAEGNGGGIYVQPYNQFYTATLTIEGGEISGNTAVNGGGVGYGDFGIDIENISAGPDAVFRGNRSEQAYLIRPEDKALHDELIKTSHFSNGHVSAYNNDDIQYTLGKPIDGGDTERIANISSGSAHNLLLYDDGTVWSWGDNTYGQTGTGGSAYARVPGLVDVVAVAAGDEHSLALTANGIVYAWGNGANGRLGNGAIANQFSPVQVAGLTDITAIAAGANHSLALSADGSVYAWGLNTHGNLGNGATTASSRPVLSDIDSVVQIDAGSNFSLVLKSDGTAWAWGRNNVNQLGDGTTISRNVPVQVSNLGGVRSVAAGGDHAMAILADGTAYAWGRNNYGQLGNGLNINAPEPVQISGLSDVAQLGGGERNGIALLRDGSVWVWGNNSLGQLGNGGDGTVSRVPSKLDLTDIASIAWGMNHGLALDGEGAVYGWGLNDAGQLRENLPANVLEPTVLIEGGGSVEPPFDEVQARIDEINAMWSMSKPSFPWRTAGIYEDPISLAAPYAAGALKDAYLQDALNMLNFHRYLAGVPHDVVLDTGYSNHSQHAVVICKAIDQLTHYPDQPADMDDAFYQIAALGASSSNMANYYANFNLAQSVAWYLYDSDASNTPILGHRRWCLNPQMKMTGFGQAENYAAMYAKDGAYGDGGYDHVSYPNGPAFPNDFFESNYAWSVSLSQYQYKLPDLNAIHITLRNEEGLEWEFYDGCRDTFYLNTGSYGRLSYCLIFRPESGITAYNGRYDVEITGLQYLDGTDVTLTYSVTFFALDEPVNYNPQGVRSAADFHQNEVQLGPVPEQ